MSMRVRVAWRVVAVTSAAIAMLGVGASACSLVVDLDGLSGGGTDGASSSSGGDGGGGLDGSSGDASLEVSVDAADGGACPGREGPTGVRVGAYCIDATEVTNAQYARFLDAKGTDTSGQPAVCTWNTSYTPAVWPVPGGDALPATNVDWCDAVAYCAWAGKRLCGAIAGGPTPYGAGSWNNAEVDQWYRACSAGGTRKRPYGNDYVAKACNVGADGGALLAAGGSPECVGGFPGLFDMVGNATEWTSSCATSTGPDDECVIRESWYESAASEDCTSTGVRPRSGKHQARGFRCCTE